MTIRRNERANVSFSTTRLNPRVETAGTLTGDVLNVVSPSFKGPAFVPVNISSIQDAAEKIGDERQNLYGHLYDEFSCFKPNQGMKSLINWFNNGGQNAVHTRILGIGDGKQNSIGTYDNAGINLSDKNLDFVFSSLDVTNEEESQIYLAELGVSDNGNIQDHLFLSHVIMTNENVNLSVENEGIQLSEMFLKYTVGEETISGCRYSDSLMNKKPVNFSTSHDNLFGDLIKDRQHFVYARFGLNQNLNGTINSKILSTKDAQIDYKDFSDIYQTASTPWITSQPIDRTGIENDRSLIHEKVIDLFRFHALDDGEAGNRFKIKINPTRIGNSNVDLKDYSEFDIYIFEYEPRDNTFTLLESFENLNMIYDDDNFIGRRIGTYHKFYNIETNEIIEEGDFSNVSMYLRVEVNPVFISGKLNYIQKVIPSGFRAYPHIDCSKLSNVGNLKLYSSPLKYYRRYNDVTEIDGLFNTWGVEMYVVGSDGRAFPSLVNEDIKTYQNEYHDYLSPHYYHTKFFTKNKNNNSNVMIDDDTYLNSFFHIEKIVYNKAKSFKNSRFIRSGSLNSLLQNEDFINLDKDDFEKYKNNLSFDLFTAGGYDGLDVLSNENKFMTNKSMLEEILNDSRQSILNSYVLGVKQTVKYENCNGTILVAPDITNSYLHNICLNIISNFDRYVYLADYIDLSLDYTKSLLNYSLNPFYTVKKKLSGYYLNEFLGENYSLNEPELKLKNIIDNRFDIFIDSKHLVDIFSGLSYLISQPDGSFITTNMTGSAYLCGVLSNPVSLSNNAAGVNVIINSTLGSVNSLKFVDSLKIRLDNRYVSFEEEEIKRILFNLNLNTLTEIGNRPQFLSFRAHTSRFSNIDREIEKTRAIQFIKNSLMIDLYTNTSIISDTVLFNTITRSNALHQRIKIQVTNLMNSFVNLGLITGFVVNIDDMYYDNNFEDVTKNIFRGNIIIQFGQSNIIELSIDNIISDLTKVLSDGNKLELPII